MKRKEKIVIAVKRQGENIVFSMTKDIDREKNKFLFSMDIKVIRKERQLCTHKTETASIDILFNTTQNLIKDNLTSHKNHII